MLSEQKLQAIWYDGATPPWWMRALTPVYATLSNLRRRLYAAGILRRERLSVPVVVIGNITIGGTGKTPLVIALVQALRARGWNPGVVGRGYAGTAQTSTRVDAQSDPQTVGDEACLIFQASQTPVIVGRDRVTAARELLRTAQLDVLIADDGLQHYRLARDIEICVIDGARRFGNGRLLPSGPLREPMARLSAFTYRVCNGGVAAAGEIAMKLDGDAAVSLRDPEQRRTLRDFSGQRVHAVAGIGNPARFFAQLRASGIDPVEHAFADHHPFVAADLDFGDTLPVLMTAKDAVKCRGFARSGWWSVPVQAQLPPAFVDDLAGRLKQLRDDPRAD